MATPSRATPAVDKWPACARLLAVAPAGHLPTAVTSRVGTQPEPRGKLEDAKAALRAELERRAAELGIASGDLFSWLQQQMPVDKGARARKPRDDIGAKRAVKYRGPSGEEWSGRGRTPSWLTALEAEGRGREEFLIE